MPLSFVDPVSILDLVTIGHILGGMLLVALIYWFVYLRGEGEGDSAGVR